MRPRLITAASIMFVLAIVVSMQQHGWLAPLENLAHLGFNGVSKALYRTSVSDDYSLTTSTQILEATVKRLEDENAVLREQLQFFASTTIPHVGADVIGRDIDPLGTTLVINAGTRSNLKIDQPVITNNGQLIGRIVRVSETTAIVRLLTDPQSRLAATVLNRDHSLGVIEGGYGISVRLNFIPQNEIVVPGDYIITSGLEPSLPRGLYIGQVEVVEKKPQQPFQEAVLKTAADLHHLTVVSVLLYGS